MYETILVPTDGSDHAVRAGEYAATIARTFDATVHVFSVIDTLAAGGPFNAGGLDASFLDRLEAETREAIDDVTEVLHSDLDAETAVVRGQPAEAILEYAESHSVDLIAMGTHGRTGVRRYVAGSVTERVVRHAPVPVLTAQATESDHISDGFDEIIVPTDGSKYAGVAVDHALAVASRFDARIHAVSVVDLGDVVTSTNYSPPVELLNELERRGETATEEIAARASEAGLDATTTVRTGRPGAEILAYAEETDADLIAMGTAGRTGPSRFLLGSTTERIIRHAEIPVLAVNARPPEE